MSKKEFNVVGKPVIRQDARAKVTGEAKFGDDLNYPNQLYGVMVRIPAVHARLKRIDGSALRGHPDVTAVLDAADIPGARKIGAIHQDQPIFAYEKIVTPGDVVAMLVGPDEEKLLPLREKVQVEWEELPALTDPRQALQPDAPRIHPQYPDNLIVHHPLRKGDVEKGFAESDHILEQTYTTPHVEHAAIEPEVVIALPLERGRGVKVIGSIQNPFTARKVVAAVLDLPLTKVRIEQAEMGGSFGGKDDIMCVISARAALAALKTGRPVKIRYTREDSILESYKRHPYILNYKVGFSKEGRIRAMKIDLLADGGAYASMTPFVTWRSVVQATGPYDIEHVWTDVRGVYTNNPYTGAMRGFGSPQPIFAQESLMDEIALQVGKTPDEIRRLNGLRQGGVTATGHKLEEHEVTLLKVLDTAVQESGFREKWLHNREENPPLQWLSDADIQKGKVILEKKQLLGPRERWRKGIGLAVSLRGCSLGAEGIDAAAAYLSLQTDGSCYLLCGLAENGQGLRATYSIIAAEVLGLTIDDIYYLDMDTGYIADSGPTVASRATLMGGGATRDAAETVRRRLEDVLREKWQLPENSRFIFKDKTVFNAVNPRQKIAFGELCQLAYGQGVNLAALGWYGGPHVHWDEEKGQGPAYFTYVYGCQVAEVQVNAATGEVYVERVVAVHDPGTVINLLGAQGQVYGGVTQGAGYGLWEEVSTYDGRIRELNFDQYLIPTAKDVGEIVPIFVEGEDPYGAWGGKSLGEPTLELTAAAINNAVRNALGKRFFHLPVNLEEIVLGRKLHPEDIVRGSAL